ncbi:TPA: helix-turn-helix domain-containing protein, partial [Salmonella enterica]|nr:helix-turn-helix domain-containing protein [Salmonella enterica]
IQQRTGLSRSRIMQVLSELKARDYIKILHGRLLELRNLPVSF